MTRRSDIPVYSSKRNFYYDGGSHKKSDKCCTQAIFHDQCDRCEKCDKCCKCPKKWGHESHDHRKQHECDHDRWDKCDKCDKYDKCCECRKEPEHKVKHEHHHHTDPFSNNNSDATVTQEADQYSFMEQESGELIWVKESCNIKVNSTDTQVGLSLQAALQLAIAIVLNISIADSNRSEAVSQELMQHLNTEQTNKQKIYIYNTKDANVTTTDTDLAVNLQVMLQVLIALVVMIDIL